MSRKIGRRGFVAGVAGLGAAGLIGSSPMASSAQTQSPAQAPRPAGTRPAAGLPARGEFLVRNGYVLTMDPALGDIPGGDVHVKNGSIVAVGKNLKAPGALVLDGRRMIVLPGLVDTHWHMWTTYLRCMAGDKTEDGYFPVTTRYGEVMKPEDMYHSTRLAAAEAIYSGTTTLNDECHNVRSLDYAVADIRALRETGIRARFSYGSYRGVPPGEPRDLASFEKLHGEWAKHSPEGLITLGYTWGGVPVAAPNRPAPAQERIDAARKEIRNRAPLGHAHLHASCFAGGHARRTGASASRLPGQGHAAHPHAGHLARGDEIGGEFGSVGQHVARLGAAHRLRPEQCVRIHGRGRQRGASPWIPRPSLAIATCLAF